MYFIVVLSSPGPWQRGWVSTDTTIHSRLNPAGSSAVIHLLLTFIQSAHAEPSHRPLPVSTCEAASVLLYLTRQVKTNREGFFCAVFLFNTLWVCAESHFIAHSWVKTFQMSALQEQRRAVFQFWLSFLAILAILDLDQLYSCLCSVTLLYWFLQQYVVLYYCGTVVHLNITS